MCVPSSLSSTISSFRGDGGGLAYNGAAYSGTAAAVTAAVATAEAAGTTTTRRRPRKY